MSLLDLWVLFMVLGTVTVFAAGVWVLSRLARRHRDDDARAGSKVAVAVVVALLLGVGGLFVLHKSQADGVVGIHKTFTNALNITIGEGDYIEQGKTIAKKTGPSGIPFLEAGIANVNATLDAYFAQHPEQNRTSAGLPAGIQEELANYTAKAGALTAAKKDLNDAIVKQRSLTPNHMAWLQVQPLIAAGRDDEAEAIVRKTLDAATVTEVLPLDAGTAANNQAPCERDPVTGLCAQPLKAKALEHSFFDAHLVRNIPFEEGGPDAFNHQREFNGQMDWQMKLFTYPSVTGLLMAPLVFAGGAHVFPGGAVDDTDRRMERWCAGLTDDDASA
ncbi:MAG: hypothetical protein ABR562_04090, partial [Thermoplasmatota archaeon]